MLNNKSIKPNGFAGVEYRDPLTRHRHEYFLTDTIVLGAPSVFNQLLFELETTFALELSFVQQLPKHADQLSVFISIDCQHQKFRLDYRAGLGYDNELLWCPFSIALIQPVPLLPLWRFA